MALRDGIFITVADGGERLYYCLHNGSPYQVTPDDVLELAPGYYDDELRPVPAKVAVAPEEP
jgi:hypothetical protein